MPRRGTTTQRGYGSQHVQRRNLLLYQLIDGSPCWWCGKPLYKDKNKNFDKKPLHADHSAPVSKNSSSLADRLLHHTCNSERGDGSRDHLRPVLNNTMSDNTESADWDWTDFMV